jgi:hypothetical protein
MGGAVSPLHPYVFVLCAGTLLLYFVKPVGMVFARYVSTSEKLLHLLQMPLFKVFLGYVFHLF